MLETTLITKVAVLLAACMGLGGLGAYLGRKIENPLVFIGLAIAFILGTFGVFAAAHASPVLGVLALAGWTFVSGLVTAPALQHYSERLGWRTVAGAFAGTGGVMAACGAFGAFSGIDFSFLSGILFFALLGLVVDEDVGEHLGEPRSALDVHLPRLRRLLPLPAAVHRRVQQQVSEQTGDSRI